MRQWDTGQRNIWLPMIDTLNMSCRNIYETMRHISAKSINALLNPKDPYETMRHRPEKWRIFKNRYFKYEQQDYLWDNETLAREMNDFQW